jgi:hypothetical protein
MRSGVKIWVLRLVNALRLLMGYKMEEREKYLYCVLMDHRQDELDLLLSDAGRFIK